MKISAPQLILSCLAISCATESSPSDDSPYASQGSPGDESSDSGPSDATGSGEGSDVADDGPGTSGTETADDDGDDGASTGGAEQGGTDGDDESDSAGEGPSPTLPQPIGSCPAFTAGELVFNPAGGARQAQVWIDPAAARSKDGPVVFYWYGTGGQPDQAIYGLGTEGISRITSAGGIVVAPVHANGGTFPWLAGGDADFRLADEVIGCAQEEIGIDARQIHSLGFSAGGLFTSAFSFTRSSYIASVATYSGGGTGTFQDPGNRFAAMILYGGPSDDVFGQNFEQSSRQYQSALAANGNFAFLCNHGDGHNLPSDAAGAVVDFFFAHPFGVDPSPYDGEFPAAVPSYCEQP